MCCAACSVCKLHTRLVFVGIDNAGLLGFVAAWYVKAAHYLGGISKLPTCSFWTTAIAADMHTLRLRASIHAALNLVKIAPSATMYHSGLLSSTIHNAWVRRKLLKT